MIKSLASLKQLVAQNLTSFEQTIPSMRSRVILTLSVLAFSIAQLRIVVIPTVVMTLRVTGTYTILDKITMFKLGFAEDKQTTNLHNITKSVHLKVRVIITVKI